MKKAILGTGIGWGILLLISAIPLIIFAIVARSPEFVQALVKEGISQQEAELAATAMGTGFMIAAIVCVIAAVYSFVLIGLRNAKMGKGAGIALGVVGIVIGATLPAIFFLVDSAMTR